MNTYSLSPSGNFATADTKKGTGKVQLDASWKQCNGRRSSTIKSQEYISKPTNLDILCGRGRGFFEHAGNRRMLSILSPFKADYQLASKCEKSVIAQRVLELILKPGDGPIRPRFLKKVTGKGKKVERWYELEKEEIIKKVAHTLREQKAIIKMSAAAIRPFAKRELVKRSTLALQNSAPLVQDVAQSSLFRRDSVQIADIDLLLEDIDMSLHLQLDKTSTSVVSDDEHSSGSVGNGHRADLISCASACGADLEENIEPLSLGCEPIFQQCEIEKLMRITHHHTMENAFDSCVGIMEGV